ncbi:hypothetical protein PtB15_1B605 [Puccinia triticina]|nr:hypothetical protein PtB15_1B605 [Puccinia triticina]
MSLRHYLVVFVLIGQLITDTYAFVLPETKIWLPHTPPAESMAAATSSSSFLNLPHKEAISAFKTLFVQRKIPPTELFHKVLHWLLSPNSMSCKDLVEWCDALADAVIARDGCRFGKNSIPIIFGLQTLRLRNTLFMRNLSETVKRLLPEEPRLYNRESTWEPWIHELKHPYHRFSKPLREWGPLKALLMSEPRLSSLGSAIHSRQPESIIEKLNPTIKEIFSRESAGDVSSETRLVAIATLVYLLKNAPDKYVGEKADQLMNSLINPHNGYVLLSHERTLLGTPLIKRFEQHHSIKVPMRFWLGVGHPPVREGQSTQKDW